MRWWLSFLVTLWVVPVHAQLLDLYRQQQTPQPAVRDRDRCDVTIREMEKLDPTWVELAVPAMGRAMTVGLRCQLCSPEISIVATAEDTNSKQPLDASQSTAENTEAVYTDSRRQGEVLRHFLDGASRARAFYIIENAAVVGRQVIDNVPMIGIRYSERGNRPGWPKLQRTISYQTAGNGCFLQVAIFWETEDDLVGAPWTTVERVLAHVKWSWDRPVGETMQSRNFRREMKAKIKEAERSGRGEPIFQETPYPSPQPLPPLDKRM